MNLRNILIGQFWQACPFPRPALGSGSSADSLEQRTVHSGIHMDRYAPLVPLEKLLAQEHKSAILLPRWASSSTRHLLPIAPL